jgi:predicted nucleic acid-binding Zn ribbon protein
MSPDDPTDPDRPGDPRLVEPVGSTVPDPDADPDAGAAADAGGDHDDTGLDLARSIARALVRPGARRRTRPGSGTAPRPARRVDPRASGAHPDERDPQLLDSTIGRLIAEQGWGTDVRVHGVFSRWDVIVGREVAQHCAPESFNDGKLVVRTDSTAWATQMRMLAPTVVRRLNEELGDGTVTLIDVQGPYGPTWKRGPRSVRDGRGPRDTYG